MVCLIKALLRKFRENAAYSLAELSISVSIIAMLAVGALSAFEKKSNSDNVAETIRKMEQINKSLKAFAALNQYLPCPALPNLLETSANFGKSEGLTGLSQPTIYKNVAKVAIRGTDDACSNNGMLDLEKAGAVPVRTLGLSDDYTYDGWGRKFTYVIADGAGSKEDFIDPRFRSDIGIVDRKGIHKTNINNPPPFNSGAAFVLISYGKNGKDTAWRRNNVTSPSKASGLEAGNTDHARKIYVQSEITEGFDDIVLYGMKQNFIAPKNISAPMQIEPIACENAKKILDGGRDTLNSFAASGGNANANMIFNAAKKISILCDNGPAVFNIASMTNLEFWLDADDNSTFYTGNNCTTGGSPTNNTAIGCWKNKNGSTMHAVQSNAAYKPLYLTNVINYKPVVRFDGSNDNLAYPDIGTFSQMTLILVHKQLSVNSSGQFHSIMSHNSWGGGFVHMNLYNTAASTILFETSLAGRNPTDTFATSNYNTTGVTRLTTTVDNNQTQKFYLNGAADGTTNISSANNKTIGPGVIGAWDAPGISRPLHGDIGELVFFSRAIDETQRKQIEAYLGDKWGIAISDAIKKDVCPKGMTFRKTKEQPKGACLCPEGKAYINELTPRNACFLPSATTFSGCVSVNTPPSYQVSPSVNGMVFWLDANDCSTIQLATNNKVSTWQDKSTNGRDATQTSDSLRPIYDITNTINALPVIKFNGSSQYLNLPSLTSLTSGEIFGVVKNSADPNSTESATGSWYFMGSLGQGIHFPYTNGLIYDNFGSSNTRYQTSISPGQKLNVPVIYNVVATSGEWANYLNGMQLLKSNSNTVGFSNAPRLGNNPWSSYYYSGFISEVILYDRKLPENIKTTVMNYLSDKWDIAIGPNFIPSKAAAPTNFKLWLDASDSSTLFESSSCAGLAPNSNETIGCWKDKSSSALRAIQGDTSKRPTYILKQKKDLPTIKFLGNEFLAASGFQGLYGANSHSFFFVAKIDNHSNADTLLQGGSDYSAGLYVTATTNIRFLHRSPWGSGGGDNAYSGNISADTYYVISMVRDGAAATQTAWVNGTAGSAVTSFSVGAQPSTDMTLVIGSNGIYGATGNYLVGEVGEILGYNIALTNAQRQYLEGYLGDKWGITLP